MKKPIRGPINLQITVKRGEAPIRLVDVREARLDDDGTTMTFRTHAGEELTVNLDESRKRTDFGATRLDRTTRQE